MNCESIRRVAGVVAAILWLAFGITGVIRWTAGDGGLLAAEMLRTAPPEATGLPEKDYPGVGAMTAEYLTGKREKFQYVVAQGAGNGTACARSEVFQEKEAAHMADCRALILLDTRVCIGCGIAAALLTAFGLFRRERRKGFLQGILWGMRIAGVLAGGILIWALVNFRGLFVTFHRVAFRNDGWLLNPKTDLLIRLMPTQFFMRLGIRGLVRFAAMPAAMLFSARYALKRIHNA